MQIYLIGGAVRDALLGRPVADRDYVVVGSDPEEMLRLGFRAVGKDFPVFLHPETGEEYALARTERKNGRGYHGFQVYAAADVTLEQDLARRDLTINAIARDAKGQLIDPYDGIGDLERRLLRHVSPAFVEDPLRLLRIARFAARFAPLGFSIAPETLALLHTMVAAGEVDHLVPERVWTETRKALGEARPSAFFEVLQATGALPRLFPELAALDTHQSEAAKLRASKLDTTARLAPSDDRIGYAVLSQPLDEHALHKLSARLRVPNEHAALAQAMVRHYPTLQRALQLTPDQLLQLLEALDAWRRPQQLERFLLASACCQGEVPPTAYPQAQYLRRAAEAARDINAASFLDRGLQGPAIGSAMREARREAIADVIMYHSHPHR